MDAGDVELDHLGDVVRVQLGQSTEQRADALRDGLEDDERLLSLLDPAAPEVPGADRLLLGARGEPRLERPADRALRAPVVRERAEHQPHRPGGVDGVHRVRGHAASAVRAGRAPEKS
jgi:hypothetical protein